PSCLGGCFPYDSTGLFADDPQGRDHIVLRSGQLSIVGRCPPTLARLGRPGRKGTTIAARWTNGTGVGAVKLKGRLLNNPGVCGRLTAMLRMGKRRHVFSGDRIGLAPDPSSTLPFGVIKLGRSCTGSMPTALRF